MPCVSLDKGNNNVWGLGLALGLGLLDVGIEPCPEKVFVAGTSSFPSSATAAHTHQLKALNTKHQDLGLVLDLGL